MERLDGTRFSRLGFLFFSRRARLFRSTLSGPLAGLRIPSFIPSNTDTMLDLYYICPYLLSTSRLIIVYHYDLRVVPCPLAVRRDAIFWTVPCPGKSTRGTFGSYSSHWVSILFLLDYQMNMLFFRRPNVSVPYPDAGGQAYQRELSSNRRLTLLHKRHGGRSGAVILSLFSYYFRRCLFCNCACYPCFP